MSLRVKIKKILLLKSQSGQKHISDDIFEMLDNAGLGLSANGWLDNEDTEQCPLSRHVQDVIANNQDPDVCAMKILFTLDDEGLSLLGNGWLDDDDEAKEFIDNEYSKKYL
jgi:uncharacterized protein YidB (DUF937 family)